MISKFKKNGTLSNKPRSGRPKKLSDTQRRAIIRSCINDPSASSSELANDFNNYSVMTKISHQLVRHILFQRGLRSYSARKKPFLTKKMMKSRIDFCKTYGSKSSEFWRSVIFSDESYCEINMNSVMNRVRRFASTTPYQPNLVQKTVKHPIKVMTWGCFNYSGIGRIQICEGNMNQQYYLKTLENRLKPSISDLGIQNPIHLDDSARPHRTRIVNEWHTENGIQKISWPGNSPDLNPIENLWAILKNKLRKRQNRTKEELIRNIIRIWHHEISDDIIKNLADSMPNRIERVVKNKGGNTKY